MVHSAEDGSIPVPDMSALIARLEAAEAGSRELDLEICNALGVFACLIAWDSGSVTHGGPAYTTSLDAGLALAERVLPVHMRGPIALEICGSGQAYIDHSDACGQGVRAFAQSPAVALCIAILKAKAQGEGG